MDHARRAGLILLCSALWGQQITFDAKTGTVEVSGARTAERLQVYLGEARTPILGDYTASSEGISFAPRFPFLEGREHRAEYGGAVLRFTPPAAGRSQTARVTEVFPSGAVVPANLLRIYVVFSQPMAREDFGNRIRLLDCSGAEVEQAFLHVEGGLWNADATRLTVLLEPGRIKTGLAMHERLRLALKPGKRFTLSISKEIRDAFGGRLAADFVREYEVAAEDRSSPRIADWTITPPSANTRETLRIVAEKPLDVPLFARLVWLENEDQTRVEGSVTIAEGGREWRFVPAGIWKPGRYLLRVAPELEDLAGNRPGELFEVPAGAARGVAGQRREFRVQ